MTASVGFPTLRLIRYRIEKITLDHLQAGEMKMISQTELYNLLHIKKDNITMLKSMTGFGRAEQTVNDKTFLVEIKSLNGKQFEINLKIPPLIKPYEFDIRNLLQENLLRGTVECLIIIKQNGASKPVVINTDLIKAYYNQINDLATELDIDTNSVLSALLRLPEVVSPSNEILGESDWAELKKVLDAAITGIKLPSY